MLWLLFSVAALGADASGRSVAVQAIQPSGNQWLANTPSFQVRNFHPAQDARVIAEQCERWRSKLQNFWCPNETAPWEVRCEVTLHGAAASYLAVVGTGGQGTFGSSSLLFSNSKKVSRRAIDLRGDSPRGLAALPHEMTHVILADLLDGRQPPRWADEGMAILADEREKQLLHERDLAQGLSQGTAFHVAHLLTMEAYPSAGRVAAFYGQSASLTACLAKRDDPSRFVAFLRRALDAGYDQALRETYRIRDVAELERLWQNERMGWKSGYHGVQLALSAPAAGSSSIEAISN